MYTALHNEKYLIHCKFEKETIKHFLQECQKLFAGYPTLPYYGGGQSSLRPPFSNGGGRLTLTSEDIYSMRHFEEEEDDDYGPLSCPCYYLLLISCQVI